MYCNQCGTPHALETCPVCGHNNRVAHSNVTPGANVQYFDPETTLPLSGWWRRVGASTVDGLVLAVPGLVLTKAIGPMATIVVQLAYFTLSWRCKSRTMGNMAVGTSVVRDDGSALTLATAFGRALSLVVWNFVTAIGEVILLRHLYLEGSGQATALHLTNGWAPGAIMMATGWLLSVLNGLWPLWDARRQAWHDKVAGTLVVMTPKN